MYTLKETLLSEIEGFRQLGHQFVNGEINRADFKGISGGMGVYAHRDGKNFMIRLRMPGGVVSKEQLKGVYKWAQKYQLSFVHLTTRQAIQLHGLTIDQVCEVMEEALAYDIYTRGGGGNFPRNVATSPLSGVEAGEAFDITPYALLVNTHFVERMCTYKLPRKFKAAFSNNGLDHANCTVTDIGFLAVQHENNPYFKLYLGGGLGKNSSTGVVFDELVAPKDVLYHVEAIIKLFMAEGDYQNKGKARIRYIAQRMGEEAFIACYRHYLEREKQRGGLDLAVDLKTIEREGLEILNENHSRLFKQKQKGLYSIYTHPVGGQLETNDLKELLDALEQLEEPDIRLTMTEGFYIRQLNGKEAEHMLEITEPMGGGTRFEQSTACIGVPICQVGFLNGQSTLLDSIKYLKDQGLTRDILPAVRISGCPNSCGTHEVGTLGFVGKMKKVGDKMSPVFELHIKGSTSPENLKLAMYKGDLCQEDIPQFLYELARLIDEEHVDFSEWLLKHDGAFAELFQKFEV
ncbi:MAG: ferredoxin-nitrite reductase [Clostridia bacterium]|jgi:ferredoxin-nitrite reductase|nr:ferredoxin-nitrite reductase [Clostridia bacterium]